MTKPIFVVGSGRSGTQSMWRMLDSIENVEMHHEYMIHYLQPAGVKYFHGKLPRRDLLALLRETYGAAIHYCDSEFWGDCSNKASWFIDELAELFPEARFIHLVRDGRKVTSSLYHKLGHECLDDQSVARVKAYLFENNNQDIICPPPEKKYWWPLADQHSADWEQYSKLDHYGRIAYHWQQINSRIIQSLNKLDSSRYIRVRLEDITQNKTLFDRMINALSIADADDAYELIKKPFNVIRPENNPLNEQQLDVFWHYGAELMSQFGYKNEEEYQLNYREGGYLNGAKNGN